ncbi:MAG: MBL fold metallo-hydrolase [Candidatus Bathyarchaeota archaeon]|nr:MBL fold metallo-hydrolase [Candidatus Bathyarchaeota archaeon]
MHTTKIGSNLFLVDLQTGGFRKLISSYILKGKETLIVETGPTSSIPNLLSGLQEINVKPEAVTYIALTHIHLDHAGGAGTLLKKLPNAKIIVHPKGAPHLKNPAVLWEASKKTLDQTAEIFGEPEPVPEERMIVAHENMSFDLGDGLTLTTLTTPGHAAHNLSFYEQLNRGVFPGDSAGAYLAEFDVVFPTTPPPFRPDIAVASLDKLISLNPKFLFYSHFGKATDAVNRLRSYQEQIKLWLNLVQEALKRGESDASIRETVLREDKSIRDVVAMLKTNPVQEKTLIKNSIQGFINYAKNAKS